MLIEILVNLGAPLLRAGAGWLENSLEDGKITRFELAKLGSTMVRVGLISLSAWFGFQSMGVNMPAIATGLGAVVFDHLLLAFKAKVKKK